MNRGVLLYLLVFGLAILSVWQPTVPPWLYPLLVMGVLPAGALWLWHRDGRKFSELGFGPSFKINSGLVIGVLAGLIVPQLVTALLFATGILSAVVSTWPVSLVAGIVGGISVGVFKSSITVLLEEIVFRGFFIQYLKSEVNRSLVVSSLLFSLAHVPTMMKSGLAMPYFLIGLLSFFIFGVALGLGFIRSGNSLALPLGLHFGYNVGYSLLIFVVSAIMKQPMSVQYSGPAWLVGQPSWAPETGLIGVFVVFAIAGCVLRLKSRAD